MGLFFQSRKSVFSRMFLSFTFVLVILIIGSSFGLYAVFENAGLRMVADANKKILSQISYSANYMNENARNFAFSVFSDPDVTQLMYQHEEDPRLLINMDRLNRLMQTNSFIYSFYIYNSRINQYYWVGDTSYEYPPGTNAKENMLLSVNPNRKKFTPYPRKLELKLRSSDGNPQTVNVFTYVVYELTSNKNVPEGAVIVNVKGEYLDHIIQSLQEKNRIPDTNTFIVDEKGFIISGGKQFLTDTSKMDYVQSILQSNEDSGYSIATINGEKMMVTFVSSDVLGWKFFNVTPYDVITSPIDGIKRTMMILCVGLLLIGFAVSFLISSKISSPIRTLVGSVKNLTKGERIGKNMDEVAWLSQAFTVTHHKAQLLEASERDREYQRRNELLSSLLLDPQTSYEIAHLQSLFAKHNFDFEFGRSYLLLSWRLDHYAEMEAGYSNRDRTLLRYAIANSVNEWLRKEYRCETVDLGEDRLISVLQGGADSFPDEQQDKLEHAIKDIQHWIAANLKLSVTASIGYVHADLSLIQQAYQEVYKISQYRLIFNHGALLKPSSLAKQNTDAYRLSAAKEKQFLDAILAGKFEDMAAVYAEITDELRSYSHDTIVSAILYIIYLTYNSVITLERNSVNKFHVDFNALTMDISRMETLEQITERFHRLFAHISTVMQEQKPKRNTAVAGAIAKLIESNYQDKMLCLEEIANTMNMSKVYIGKLFREAYGQSVADYITDVRFKKATELMNRGITNLNDILNEIGMENSNYFYKLFKVKMGVSFSEYKTKHLEQIVSGKERLGG
ncbi:helix-turn-helix domain-containing protein [Paenibacillus germinis]|nr:helix-turn-helix domain-containing protein [Paenibacillus germinis]